jgi:ABC-type phosphate transport system auxiliary subunit
MKAVQSLMRKRLKLRERRAQLEAQLDHAKSRDFNGPLDKV